MNNNYKSKISVIKALGRFVDFNGNLDGIDMSDSKAMENDWKMVGNDINRSIDKYEKVYR